MNQVIRKHAAILRRGQAGTPEKIKLAKKSQSKVNNAAKRL